MLSMHERRGPVEAVALSWRAWWGIKATRPHRGGEVTSIAAGGGTSDDTWATEERRGRLAHGPCGRG
jgi:hypothetical protein